MPVDYARQFNLPHSSWLYKPYKFHFNRTICAYCNERAETADSFPNHQYFCTRASRLQLNAYWLVDACLDCRRLAECDNAPTFAKRRYAILVALRKRYETHRGGKLSISRQALLRRIAATAGGIRGKDAGK